MVATFCIFGIFLLFVSTIVFISFLETNKKQFKEREAKRIFLKNSIKGINGYYLEKYFQKDEKMKSLHYKDDKKIELRLKNIDSSYDKRVVSVDVVVLNSKKEIHLGYLLFSSSDIKKAYKLAWDAKIDEDYYFTQVKWYTSVEVCLEEDYDIESIGAILVFINSKLEPLTKKMIEEVICEHKFTKEENIDFVNNFIN